MSSQNKRSKRTSSTSVSSSKAGNGSSSGNKTNNVGNDEEIARALAKEEQERADSEYARRLQQQQQNHHHQQPSSFQQPIDLTTSPDSSRGGVGGGSVIVQGRHVPPRRQSTTTTTTTGTGTGPNIIMNCPLYHGLNPFLVSYGQHVKCSSCSKKLQHNDRALGCVVCNYNVCDRCFSIYSGGGSSDNNNNNNNGWTTRQRQVVPQPQYPHPQPQPLASVPPSSHMCIVDCIIGGEANSEISVEMMIDTGAQTSVMSLPLARHLGLGNRINSTYRGVANGVGTARICGKIQNVIAEFPGSHVEFSMDFMVIDVPDKLLLLGLDLMRKFNCIVNIQKEVLVFGGDGGVEVKMLPASQRHRRHPLRNVPGNGGCPTM